jgi:hypothetical protein
MSIGSFYALLCVINMEDTLSKGFENVTLSLTEMVMTI